MIADLEPHRGLLHGLCYRMLGTPQDADEVVQDTFLRALERPPPDRDRPLRPWLVKVATNLARDRLRRRRTRAQVGPWLPAPVPRERIDPGVDPELRAHRAQSASYAWMVAVEALTPEQRAVVLLRDVFDLTVAEAADVLDRTPEAVRALHARGRRALAEADAGLRVPDAQDWGAFERVIAAASAGTVDAFRDVLAADAELRSDGGGRYTAAGVPVVGAAKVARFLAALQQGAASADRFAVTEVNGGLAVLIERDHPPARVSPRAVVVLAFDAAGAVARVWTVMGDDKLAAVPPLG